MNKLLLAGLVLLTACRIDTANQSDTDTSVAVTTTDNSVTNSHNTVDNSIEQSEGATPNDNQDDNPGENPSCAGTNGPDGTGGFLWKSEADSDGNLVVLFPSEYDVQFDSVRAVSTQAGEEDEGVFSAFANGDRQHWRFSKPGSSYTGLLYVQNGDEECTWVVSDPSTRQD
jgi:hypothetical protein